MARARDVAFIHKLCSLELTPQVVMPTLLAALRVVIPSHSAGVFWVDDAGEMIALYAERMLPPDAMAAYHEHYYRHSEDGFVAAFRRRSEAADPVTRHSFAEAEHQSGYFRNVLARLDAYHVLYGILRKGGRPIAQLSLYRGRDDGPFGSDAASTLRLLLGHLGLAVARGPVPQPRDDSIMVEESLGVVDARGRVISGTDTWLRLVRLAAIDRVSPRDARQEAPIIEAFLERTSKEALDLASAASASHQISRETNWGRFEIRAYCLVDRLGHRADQVGVLVRRGEPRTLTLIRGAANSPLSPQQREVAVHLAEGRTNPEIARFLGLSANTVQYHVKQVYGRLDVVERAAVGDALLRRA